MTDLASAPAGLATMPAGAPATVYANPFISVEDTPVRFPNGKAGTYTAVTIGTGRGVLVVPMIGASGWAGASIGLLQVHRFPVGRTLLEFPRGGCEPGEEPEEAARREAVEELGDGWAYTRLQHLGVLYPDSGLLTTQMTVYAAHLETVPDPGHVKSLTGATQQWVSISKASALVATGHITDGMTLAAITLASYRR
jgi:ADP-ribose pyrophosphatase